MNTLREAALMALKALEFGHLPVADQAKHRDVMSYIEAMDVLRKALDADSMASLPEPKPYWVTERQIDRNEIVKMARAAGFFYSSGGSEYLLCRIPNLERLTALVVAAKREWKGLVDTEPVAWMVYTLDGSSAFVTDNPKDFTENHRTLPLYTAPPLSMTISGDCATSRSSNRREWQGLTHKERDEICKDFVGDDDRVGAYRSLALEVEVRLTEKNK